jgi:predicted transcriptional regulator
MSARCSLLELAALVTVVLTIMNGGLRRRTGTAEMIKSDKKTLEVVGVQKDGGGAQVACPELDARGLPAGEILVGRLRERFQSFKRLSYVFNANDDAIESLLNLLEEWEMLVEHLQPSSQSVELSSYPCSEPLAKAQRALDERQWQIQNMPTTLRQEHYVRILLALLVDTLSQRVISSKSIFLATSCSETTGLRYLDKLEVEGLIHRATSKTDRRVTEVGLTDAGVKLARKLLCYEGR